MPSTNKPLLLFDIDLTLYDSVRFRQLYPPLIATALHISLEEFSRTRQDYLNSLEKSSDFLPIRYLRHIAHTYSFPLRKLRDIYYNPELFRTSLYPDTVPALIKLKSEFILGIYSEGYTDFQITKLDFSGILKHFDSNYIFIHRRKIDPQILTQIPPNTTIVDDNLEVLNSISQLSISHLNLIWLNRTNDSDHTFNHTISTLTQLSIII